MENEIQPCGGEPISRSACLIALAGTLVLAGVLRLYQLGTESFWLDEVNQVLLCQKPWAEFIAGLNLHHAPPLHFLLTRFMLIWTQDDFLLRLPSAIFGTLSIAAAYSLLRNFFRQTTCLLATFMLTLSTTHLLYSQEARPYALYLLLSILSMDIFHRAVLREEKRRILLPLYILVSVLAIYTHYIAFFMLVTQGLIWLWFRYGLQKRSALPPLKVFYCALGMIVLYLPWLPFLMKRLLGSYSLQHFSNMALKPSDLVSSRFWLRWVEAFSAGHGYSVYLFLLAALLGLGFLWSRERTKAQALLLWLVLPTVGVLLFDLLSGAYFAYRVLLFLLPIYLALSIEGVICFAETAARKKELARALLVLVGCIVLFRFMYRNMDDYYRTVDKPPWRKVFLDMDYPNTYGTPCRLACGDNIVCLKYYIDKTMRREIPEYWRETSSNQSDVFMAPDWENIILSGLETEDTAIHRWAEKEYRLIGRYQSKRIPIIRVYERKVTPFSPM
jgi:uncharacterized membrane protein